MKRCVWFLFLTAFPPAQARQEVEITSEGQPHLVLANDRVRVFNFRRSPAFRDWDARAPA
jgi:hypothetical protein